MQRKYSEQTLKMYTDLLKHTEEGDELCHLCKFEIMCCPTYILLFQMTWPCKMVRSIRLKIMWHPKRLVSTVAFKITVHNHLIEVCQEQVRHSRLPHRDCESTYRQMDSYLLFDGNVSLLTLLTICGDWWLCDIVQVYLARWALERVVSQKEE